MKRALYILISIIGALLLSSSACEEIVNPKDNYEILIEKTVLPSTSQTVLSHENNISIIIPAGAIDEETNIKVERKSNPPSLHIDKMLLGNNTYKIKISGQTNFNSPIQIIISYSQSILDDNKITADDVRGLIYANGSWAEAEHIIDKANKKIIISIFSPSGKAKQNSDIPLEDGEIIIGDGYTTIDSGQHDDLFKEFTYIKCEIGCGEDIFFYKDSDEETESGSQFNLGFHSYQHENHDFKVLSKSAQNGKLNIQLEHTSDYYDDNYKSVMQIEGDYDKEKFKILKLTETETKNYQEWDDEDKWVDYTSIIVRELHFKDLYYEDSHTGNPDQYPYMFSLSNDYTSEDNKHFDEKITMIYYELTNKNHKDEVIYINQLESYTWKTDKPLAMTLTFQK